ncbi:MAG: TRAP transporter large permease [Chloroflexi bacterium]|nr:TRAP transporter large permease [Chloroflexota bacterium]
MLPPMAVLLGLFVLLLLIRTPVAFAFGMSSLAVLVLFAKAPLIIIPTRMIASVDSFVLLAVPLFILAGSLMETGGIALRLIGLARVFVGHVKGALGMIVVVSEMFFSGISGSTVADVSAMSSMLIPSMRRAGYKPEYSVAIVSAASAMGILIPPCILMVILGAMIGVSVAQLFFAGFLPALVLAALLMLLLYWQAKRYDLPAGGRASVREMGEAILKALIPLGMPAIIFGGILGGVFSPTEAAGIAVAYAFVVGMFVYRELTLAKAFHFCIETGVITGVVLILVQTASSYSYLMAIERVPLLVSNWILSVSDNPLFFLLVSNLIFVVIGNILEGLPAMIIFIPILLPIAEALKVDLIHWGILVIAALGIGMFIPPAGVGLIVGCAVAKVPMGLVARPLVPFMVMLLIGLAILTLVPWFSTVVPSMMR